MSGSAVVLSTRSERHVKAARARWGAPRVVRLDSLDPRVREAVLALVAADLQAHSRESEGRP